METTEKKKHKGGYELLKEKYAKLEKERDEWKAKYVKSLSDKEAACRNYAKEAVEKDKRIAFLLKHCPFWVRWMYRRQFEKGGK